MGADSDDSIPTDEQFNNPTFRAGSRSMDPSGRVHLPKSGCAEHGVTEGDVVDLRVHSGVVTFFTLDAIVLDGLRVSVPKNKRTIYDIEPGDLVALDIMVTGMSVGDSD